MFGLVKAMFACLNEVTVPRMISAMVRPCIKCSLLYAIVSLLQFLIISPNELFGDIMGLASPPPCPPIDPDE